MSILLIVWQNCTLAALHAVPWSHNAYANGTDRQTEGQTDRQTDGRTADRYINTFQHTGSIINTLLGSELSMFLMSIKNTLCSS